MPCTSLSSCKVDIATDGVGAEGSDCSESQVQSRVSLEDAGFAFAFSKVYTALLFATFTVEIPPRLNWSLASSTALNLGHACKLAQTCHRLCSFFRFWPELVFFWRYFDHWQNPEHLSESIYIGQVQLTRGYACALYRCGVNRTMVFPSLIEFPQPPARSKDETVTKPIEARGSRRVQYWAFHSCSTWIFTG